MEFIGSIVLGVLFGFVASAFANYKKPSLNIWFSKFFKKIGLDSQYGILSTIKEHKIFDDVILLDVDSDSFSSIAADFLKYKKNNEFLITNIKEPWWFYKQFKDRIFDKNKGNKSLQPWIKKYEKLFNDSTRDYNRINNIISKFNRSIYSSSINTFPHLRTLVAKNNAKRIRISFFDVNPDASHTDTGENRNSTTLFYERNKHYELYFFEKLINKETNSLFVNIQTYCSSKFEGTDALILNKRILLNHDDSIRELMYLNKDLVNAINSGFFHQITKDIEAYKKDETSIQFQPTTLILDKLYGIKI